MTKFCQSCSMPMEKDINGGGSNTYGSRSDSYCSLCFEDGKFTQPDFTVAEMQEFCIAQLNKQGMPRFMGWMLTRSLPKLERWRH